MASLGFQASCTVDSEAPSSDEVQIEPVLPRSDAQGKRCFESASCGATSNFIHRPFNKNGRVLLLIADAGADDLVSGPGAWIAHDVAGLKRVARKILRLQTRKNARMIVSCARVLALSLAKST